MSQESSFASWRSYKSFERKVRNSDRFIFDEETESFLHGVRGSCSKRKMTMPLGTIFWRARVGHSWRSADMGHPDFEIPAALGPKEMKPTPEFAREGRANAIGIPVLYCASDSKTAMSEVRPWLDSLISAARFKIVRDLTLINCSAFHGATQTKFYFEEPSKAEIEKCVWGDIDHAYSSPISPSDSNSDYVPTQILAEVFRKEGFDGIVYKSLLDKKGQNVAIFDIEDAELISCGLYKPSLVRFEFELEDQHYVIAKK
ncbi:MAG: RES family NAD+ phosphorylase [Pseudomonadota bacterium]